MNSEKFIEKSLKIHGDKYNYSKSELIRIPYTKINHIDDILKEVIYG